jgi:hypothetical protein
MSAEQQQGGSLKNEMVRRLIADTGISEMQARELVMLIGMDWSSLVREARLLRVSMQAALNPSRIR